MTADLAALLAAQRAAFRRDGAPDRDRRLADLDKLLDLDRRYGPAIAEAIDADFSCRSKRETAMAESLIVIGDIRHAKRRLGRWMRPRRVPTALHFRPGRSLVIPQPLGVVGIIAPWNYPYQLALVPLVAALAAGNRAMLKPSELTPRTSALLARMLAEAFEPDQVAVVEGDAAVGRAFAALPFDHLFFTGSTAVGREVAKAAAANLTPVTLELGGKSPAIVDASAEVATTAERIAFGKLLNAGQTCVAPDYLLVPRPMVEPLAQAVLDAARRFYPTLAGNADATAIVSDRHFARLQGLVEDARSKGARLIEAAPPTEPANQRKMPLTVILDPSDAMAVMNEEIFGPLLPIVAYDRPEDAIAHVNDRPRPLALYWFGTDRVRRDQVLYGTWAGGVTINDTLWHLAQEELPFGGIGPSGMGAYHGEAGFRTFSKDKPVFIQGPWNGAKLFYPPFGRTFDALLAVLKKIV